MDAFSNSQLLQIPNWSGKCNSGVGQRINGRQQWISDRMVCQTFGSKGHGSGLVVSMLASYLDDPGLYPIENQSFSWKMLF